MTVGQSLQLLGLLVGAVAVIGVFRLLLRREPDRLIAHFVVFGLMAKLAGSAARYTIMSELYGGADYRRYFRAGTELAGQIRSGSLPEEAQQTGTPFMEFISGVVFTFIPNQLWAGFAAFALLSFLGMFLFVQAFRLALPEGNHRLYAGLIYFSPTLVFWPSSIGKEAWLLFALGEAAYGGARSLRRMRYGYLLLALGVSGAFLVRPHMGALFALAFAGAFALRLRDPTVRGGVVGWMIGLTLVVAGAGYAFANFADELPQDDGIEGTQTDQIFGETTRRTTQGGSAYDSRQVRSIGDFGHALITVPFRPFPNEGHNRQAQIAALEGVLLMSIILFSLPRLARLPRALIRQPYVTMAAAYSVGFIIAFSNVGNFGILTRQRAQLLPLLFVLIAFQCKSAREERPPVLTPVVGHSIDTPTPADDPPTQGESRGEPGSSAPTR